MKKLGIISALLLVFLGLQACGTVNSIVYDGKETPVPTVEEIIADKLEVENPDLDLEVQIYQESDSN
jgi:hypothetical protein